MAQKKRSSKRKVSPKQKRFAKRQETRQQPLPLSDTVQQLAQVLDSLPAPARAVFDNAERFKRRYPRLYEVMFRDVNSKRYRDVERDIERWQKDKRGS